MIQMDTINVVIIVMVFFSVSLYFGKSLSSNFVSKEKMMFWWLYLLEIVECVFLFIYGLGMYGLKDKRGNIGETGKIGLKGKNGTDMDCLKCNQ